MPDTWSIEKHQKMGNKVRDVDNDWWWWLLLEKMGRWRSSLYDSLSRSRVWKLQYHPQKWRVKGGKSFNGPCKKLLNYRQIKEIFIKCFSSVVWILILCIRRTEILLNLTRHRPMSLVWPQNWFSLTFDLKFGLFPNFGPT